LQCVNWQGAQLKTFAPQGLDLSPVDYISKSIKSFGFNCVRLPYSLEMYYSNDTVADTVVAANPLFKGMTGMAVLDKVVESLTANGLMIVLNNHVSNAGPCCSTTDNNGMWYNANFPPQMFFDAVSQMALRYKDNLLVVATDLRNSVRPDETLNVQPSWGTGIELNDWRMAA